MFKTKLLHWHRHHNKRLLPWTGERDPYKIWLSEIILQQTRVEQGTKYYYALLEKYPDIRSLAEADETELYKTWQGLGYYSRCKNMWQTAKQLAQQHDGKFPEAYHEIIKLKGIGSYTAAAISSFAFDLPYAVVDGNVVRVLSRYFALSTDFYSSRGKKEFQLLAQQLIDTKKAAQYNQAIMDLGATICKPQNPLCGECPFQKTCIARISDTISEFPLRRVKIPLKKRYFHFMVFEKGDSLYIQKRTAGDIWENLYSFYTIEAKALNAPLPYLEISSIAAVSEEFTQLLTHQKIHGYFYKTEVRNAAQIASLNLLKVKKTDLKNFAFPRMIISFLQKNNYL